MKLDDESNSTENNFSVDFIFMSVNVSNMIHSFKTIESRFYFKVLNLDLEVLFTKSGAPVLYPLNINFLNNMIEKFNPIILDTINQWGTHPSRIISGELIMKFLTIPEKYDYTDFLDVFVTNSNITMNHEFVQFLFKPGCLLNNENKRNPIVDILYEVIK